MASEDLLSSLWPSHRSCGLFLTHLHQRVTYQSKTQSPTAEVNNIKSASIGHIYSHRHAWEFKSIQLDSNNPNTHSQAYMYPNTCNQLVSTRLQEFTAMWTSLTTFKVNFTDSTVIQSEQLS